VKWDFEPDRISVGDWESRMPAVPVEFEEKCRFLRPIIPGGVRYLFSPYEYSCRGDILLRRLKFDSSLEALRLWAFLFSEKDRLFLAKENGWKIVAAMKDLGQVPVLTYAFPETLTFYADELWWAPCFSEEPHLLDEAAKLGAGEELCFVRAALGAMVTLDYFPKPDLCIAGVGACCDDFSAIMQLIEGLGYPVHWWEMAARFDEPLDSSTGEYRVTGQGGSRYLSDTRLFLEGQLQSVVRRMEELVGTEATPDMLAGSRTLFNTIRGQVSELRDLVYSARRPPLPGLEMFLSEFIAIHTCSEPEESVFVLQGLLDLVRKRIGRGESPFGCGDPVRVFWVTPPTDASLITILEDLGGCIAGTEYMISHAFLKLSTDVEPVSAVAENCLDDCMTGSPGFRAKRVVEGARRYGAEGVIISGISGASHCPWDERSIRLAVERELGIPVIAFDVPFSPGRPSEQVVNRIQGFTELLSARRGTSVSAPSPETMTLPEVSADPLLYFRNSMSTEVDRIRAEKRAGKGVVGIYCEFSPRDLILAAGALPVCLCGSSRRTIPAAETVLPANLCPLIKSSFGYIITNRCPFFMVSDLVVAETTCDGKKKMYELIADRKPQHILELTQKVNEQEAFSHWMKEVERLKDRLEEHFDTEITEGKLRSAITEMNRERTLLRNALLLGRNVPSIVTGLELASLRYRISGLPEHLGMLERFVSEIEARGKSSGAVCSPDAPRVLLTGCPMAHGSLKVIEVIEESGGIVVVQETCSGWKPLDTLVDEEGDPLEAIARKHFSIPCSCMTPNSGRLELMDRLVREFSVDVVIDLVWHACHTYSVESWLVEKHVKEELGLPFLKIETDYSDSDRERLSVRIQTLLEMV
jgi:benzoyl-CoA reductase/2-hydroxyglutaryl-CoA dehydratase subunit BcrC/BadD/HgdB